MKILSIVVKHSHKYKEIYVIEKSLKEYPLILVNLELRGYIGLLFKFISAGWLFVKYGKESPVYTTSYTELRNLHSSVLSECILFFLDS